MHLDPSEGALVVTNYHQWLRVSEDVPAPDRPWQQRSMHLLFEDGEPERLEAVSTPLIERLASSRGLLVLNDEAHHVGDEPAHAQFEQKAKEKSKFGEDVASDMAWIRSIRRLNGGDAVAGRVALQADLSATLFDETGSSQRPTGASKGAKRRTEFKPTDLFRHTVVRYGLPEAIRDEVVKRPVLERVVVKNKQTGEIEDLVRNGQPNAWEKYRNLLVTGIERWKQVRDQLVAEGDKRKPILFVLCGDRNEAREVANFLRHGEAARGDLDRTPVGYKDPAGSERLFVEPTADGGARSTVVEVHIGQKEEQNEAEWELIREVVNQIDHDELPDPSGGIDASGRPVMVPNPYNVVVSVMMLKEGWDVRNVKVIVPLRPCDSRTLTEQTLGRGLRKMHAPVLDDDGGATLEREELYVIEHPSTRSRIWLSVRIPTRSRTPGSTCLSR
jgi:type III restriction enzyme